MHEGIRRRKKSGLYATNSIRDIRQVLTDCAKKVSKGMRSCNEVAMLR